jgi:hypothetical protein
MRERKMGRNFIFAVWGLGFGLFLGIGTGVGVWVAVAAKDKVDVPAKSP